MKEAFSKQSNGSEAYLMSQLEANIEEGTLASCNSRQESSSTALHVEEQTHTLESFSAKESSTETLSANLDLRSIIRNEAKKTKDWHKEILFGIFLHTDAEKINNLASTTGKSLSDCLKNRKLKNKRKRTVRPGRLQDHQHDFIPSALTLVPGALKGIKKKFSDEPRQNQQAFVDIPNKFKRKEAAYRNLTSLEKEVSNCFQNSLFGEEANSLVSSYTPAALSIIQQSKSTESSHQGTNNNSSKVAKKEETISEAKPSNCTVKPSAEYAPFSLVYNECSIAAVSKWAKGKGAFDRQKADNEARQRALDSTVVDSPAAAPLFRKCSICSKWGHYEIECDSIKTEDFISLGYSMKVQRILRGFIQEERKESKRTEERKRPGVAGGHIPQNEDNLARRPENDNSEDNEKKEDEIIKALQDEEYATKSTGCEVCGSAFDEENLLLCDGCDRLFHTQCLDPPLHTIPDEDWFCDECEGYSSDVSSDVEVEGCEGFVIEQNKVQSPMNYDQNTFNDTLGSPDDQWSLIMGITKRSHGFLGENSRLDVTTDNRWSKTNSQSVQLQIGDICWAKRPYAPKGQYGQLEFWPAKVVSVSPNTNRYKHDGMTPYVVRFLTLRCANRIRASAVLPFLEHYEELGYDRIYGKKTKPGLFTTSLRRALEQATADMGCTSLTQALVKAREIFQEKEEDTTQISEDDWDGAEITEEDGFMVMAKSQNNFAISEKENCRIQQHGIIAKGAATTRENEIEHKKMDNSGQNDSDLLPYEKLSRATPLKVVGCIVAWNSFPWSVNANSSGSAESQLPATTSIVQYGIVVSAALAYGKLLVRPLIELEKMLDHNLSDESIEPQRRPIQTSSVGATLWLNIEDLHYVSDAAPSRDKEAFSKDIHSRLKEERSFLKAQQIIEAHRQTEKRIGLVELPKKVHVFARYILKPSESAIESDKFKRPLHCAGQNAPEPKRSKILNGQGSHSGSSLDIPVTESASVVRQVANKTVTTPHSQAVTTAQALTAVTPRQNLQIMASVNGSEKGVNDTVMEHARNSIEKPCPEKHQGIPGGIQPVPGLLATGEEQNVVKDTDHHKNQKQPDLHSPSEGINTPVPAGREEPFPGEKSFVGERIDIFRPLPEPIVTKDNTKNSAERGNVAKTTKQNNISPRRLEKEADSVDLAPPTVPTSKELNQEHPAIPTEEVMNESAGVTLMTKTPASKPAIETKKNLGSETRDHSGSITAHVASPKITNERTSNDTTKEDIKESSPDSSGKEHTVLVITEANGDNTSGKNLIAKPHNSGSKTESNEILPSDVVVQAGDTALNKDTIGQQVNTVPEGKDAKEGPLSPSIRHAVASKLAISGNAEKDVQVLQAAKNRIASAEIAQELRRQQEQKEEQQQKSMAQEEAKGLANAASDEKKKPVPAKKVRKRKKKLGRLPPRRRTTRNAATNSNVAASTSATASDADNAMDESSHSSTVPETESPTSKLTKEMFGEDVFQAERILSERRSRNGPLEYLIKWKGYPMEESTWEPENNILNRNFVRIYHADKLIASLRDTPESQNKKSPTRIAIKALMRGKKLLSSGSPYLRTRICPFCMADGNNNKNISIDIRHREKASLISHISIHKKEKNYKLIKEASKLAREDWFKTKDETTT